MRSAWLASCVVVRMACRVLSHVQWTSMSLARPLMPRLLSSCNPLNTTVKRRKHRTVFSITKYLVSLFLCSRTSRLRSAHHWLIAAAADQQVVLERRSKKEAAMHASWGPSRTGSHTPLHRNRPASPSPPPRGCRPPERRVIVERVIKEASASVQYLTLTRTNYNEWSLLMRVNLQAQGLWHAIEPEEEDEVEYRDDRLTFAAILSMGGDQVAPDWSLACQGCKRGTTAERVRQHPVQGRGIS
jgi:hypothetical protein